MSLRREIMAVGQQATADFEEEDVKNLRTGISFRAKISPIQDTSLNTELGIDSRATDIFYVSDRSVEIKALDKLEAIGSRFQVLPRKTPNNPASLHLEFHCQCLVPGKDN